MSPRKAKTAAQASLNTKKTPRGKKTQTNKKSDENVQSTADTNNDNSVTIQNLNESTHQLTRKTPTSKKAKAQKRVKKTNRRKAISQERLVNVINEIGTTVGIRTEKRIKVDEETPDPLESDPEPVQVNEQRAMYSCKFCKKDFSSAFILCLHLRIHEKVGSISEPEETKPVVENSQHEIAEVHIEEAQVKEEIIEEITLSTSDVDTILCEPIPTQSVPKNEFIGIINKNFVENLRKNLSLAMNRQIN